jgi:hypothetical protein
VAAACRNGLLAATQDTLKVLLVCARERFVFRAVLSWNCHLIVFHCTSLHFWLFCRSLFPLFPFSYLPCHSLHLSCFLFFPVSPLFSLFRLPSHPRHLNPLYPHLSTPLHHLLYPLHPLPLHHPSLPLCHHHHHHHHHHHLPAAHRSGTGSPTTARARTRSTSAGRRSSIWPSIARIS